MGEALSADYWDGAARGVLVVQRCLGCGRLRHYPQVLCDACFCFEAEPAEIDGDGTVCSWTVTHHPFDTAVAADVPYTLVTVDLPAGVRMLGRLDAGGEPGRAAVDAAEGLAVRLRFTPDAAGNPMPVFVPVEASVGNG